MEEPSRPSVWPRQVLSGGMIALLLGYAALLHYGIGPFPTVSPAPWWHPRGFLIESALVGWFGQSLTAAIVGLTLPAAALVAGVFAASGSALVRTAALATMLATGLFLFYGLREPGPVIWRFFAWRGSSVMLLTGVVAGAAALSPLLAASWLRRGWALRLGLYLPILAVAVAAQRNVTGTDPHLPFNISPWPVVTVFGLQRIAAFLAGLLACAALGVAAFAHRRRRPALFAVGAAAGVAAPVAWVGLGLGEGTPLLWTTLILAALALALRAAAVREWTAAFSTPAGHVAVGAALVTILVLMGQSWVQLDYRVTRDGRAQIIIDALGSYFEREGVYPEALAELVAAKDLASIPTPQIGFAFLDEPEFSYQNFGTDYLLEFSAPGWVQCAYSPPWEERLGEDEAGSEALEPEEVGVDEGEEAEGGVDWLPGVWSCPTKPPELW